MKQSSNPDQANGYVKSIKDAVKRRFAQEYVTWVRAGKTGTMPPKGALSGEVVKTLCLNIDALI